MYSQTLVTQTSLIHHIPQLRRPGSRVIPVAILGFLTLLILLVVLVFVFFILIFIFMFVRIWGKAEWLLSVAVSKST